MFFFTIIIHSFREQIIRNNGFLEKYEDVMIVMFDFVQNERKLLNIALLK